MKEKIFKNFSLKLLSAVFAVVLWTVIVNIYDPNTSYTFSNITVQLINTQSLTDKDYSYEVVDGGKISVTVSGPKSVVTDLKTSDISATADLSKVTAFTDYVDIQVQVIKDGQVLNNVEAVPRTSALKLSIENRDTKTLSLDVNTTGSTASGYTVASTSSSPTSGIKFVSDSSLTVTVKIAQKATKQISLSASEITLNNIQTGFNAQVMQGITFTVTGNDNVLSAVSASDVKAGIDLKNLGAGTHNVTVALSLPDGITVVGNVTVNVTITAIQQETTTESTKATESTTSATR